MSGTGWDTLLEVRNWPGHTFGGPELVGRPYQSLELV